MVLNYTTAGEHDEQYIINRYSSHKFDDNHILITTEHGSWVILSKDEFDVLRTSNIKGDLNLFNILEDKGIIITERNFENIVQAYRNKFQQLFIGITLHIVVPTLRCNLKCTYCQANSKPLNEKRYDMDKKTAKAVVDFIFQSPSPFFTIEFQGGEPLLNFPIVKYIFEYANQKNESKTCDERGWWHGKKSLTFQIVSNLTTIDADILDYIMKNSIKICTSLDGPEIIHDKNRPYKSYEKVIYWINFIRNVKKYKFMTSALPTVTRYSLPHMKDIVDEYLKFGFKHVRMRPLNIAGMAIETWKKIGYTAEEFINSWKEYFDYLLTLNKKGINIFDEDVVFILKKITASESALYTCLGAPCGACLLQAGYNQWGDIYTCDEARSNEIFKLGNVKEKNYKEIFTSKHALNFIGLTSCICSACDDCVWHPYCSPCLVSTYGGQKNIIPKLPLDFLCKIRRSQIEIIFKKLILDKDNKKIFLKWMSDKRI